MKKYILLAFIILMPVFLQAHPMSIGFDEMIEQCDRILVARFVSSSRQETLFKLKVENVLKGREHEEFITVGRAFGVPYLKENQRFIAFINKGGALEWAGFADSLETDMIEMTGFYDFNAYWVYPSGITLTQLKQYIKEEKFDGRFEGNLEFFNYKKQVFEKTEISFSYTFTYYSDSVEDKVSYKNLAIIDFPKTPRLGFWGNGVLLEFEGNMIRPLKIEGHVDSVYGDGKTCHASFHVSEPRDLSKEDFDTYLSHPEYGPPYYEIEIILNDTGKYIFYEDIETERDYLQYGNRKIKAKSWGPPTRDTKGEFHFGAEYGPSPDEIMISIDTLPNEPRYKNYRGSGSMHFISGLKNDDWHGDWFQMENGQMVFKGRCTIRLKKVLFNPNVNYGK